MNSEPTVRKFNATSVQAAHMLSRINELAAQIVDVDFEDPEDDLRNIRHIIFLKGKMHGIAELHRDAYPVPPPELPVDHPEHPAQAPLDTNFTNF